MVSNRSVSNDSPVYDSSSGDPEITDDLTACCFGAMKCRRAKERGAHVEPPFSSRLNATSAFWRPSWRPFSWWPSSLRPFSLRPFSLRPSSLRPFSLRPSSLQLSSLPWSGSPPLRFWITARRTSTICFGVPDRCFRADTRRPQNNGDANFLVDIPIT